MNKKPCSKRKLDELTAMWIVAKGKNGKYKRRKEKRYYWCSQCKAYHTTRKE